jgi:hypothetical protein
MRTMSSLEGKSLIVSKAMQIAPNKYLNVGEDVTEMMKDSPALWTHLKRGYIQVVDSVQTKAQAKSEAVSAEIVQSDVQSEEVPTLKALNATASKRALRAALSEAGVEVPDGATKDDLLKLRAEALSS